MSVTGDGVTGAALRRLRIAMVSEHASPLAALGGVDAGGQNVHVAALAAHLAGRGHEVVVHTRRDDPSLPERVTTPAGYVVHHLDAGPAASLPKDALLEHVPAMAEHLRRQWTAAPPDVVHAHFWMSGLAATEAAAALPQRVPVVQTFHALGWVKRRHQGLKDTSPAGRARLEPDLASRVDAVVATATDEVRELELHGVDPARISVVPCGVDLTAFSPDGPAESRLAPRRARHRLVAVARLVERKGVETAVRALAEVPDAELVVVGGPPREQLDADPEAARLRALAAELGVGERLVLLGAVPREEVPTLLRSADAVVCTPWYEPFGIVPLEAMASGRPVVGTAVGGLVDTVLDGTTGLLVPPRDPAALARAVRGLLAAPERAERMGRAGRARVEQRYGWARVASETEAVYAAVLAAWRAAPGRAPSAAALRLADLQSALATLEADVPRLEAWGARLAEVLSGGGRLLAAGNGGSAAEAQHLTAELVGRYRDDRPAMSAIALHADTSSLTAITNDYGAEEAFARQVDAHGRPGDVVVLLSTSGRSPNVLRAAERARERGLAVWSLTGPAPNPLAALSDEAVCVAAAHTATVQEAHLVSVHLVCAAVDAALGVGADSLAGAAAGAATVRA